MSSFPRAQTKSQLSFLEEKLCSPPNSAVPTETLAAGSSCLQEDGAALGQPRVRPAFHLALVHEVMVIFAFSWSMAL